MYMCRSQKRKIQKMKERKNSDRKSYTNDKDNYNTKDIKKIKKNDDMNRRKNKKEKSEKYDNMYYDNYSYVIDKNNRDKNIL